MAGPGCISTAGEGGAGCRRAAAGQCVGDTHCMRGAEHHGCMHLARAGAEWKPYRRAAPACALSAVRPRRAAAG